MAKIAFLGTGMIGGGMVEAMLGRGDRVTVWNRTRAKAEALATKGATIAESPAIAVRDAERVHVALSDDAAVDDVMKQCIDALPKGVVVIDHTTSSPAGTAARAQRIPEYLHAPVFMSPQGASVSRGMILVAGPKARFDRVEPALKVMATDVWWLGERADLAAAFKLFGNAIILTLVSGLADVYAIATTLGIDPESTQALFQRFQTNATLTVRGAKMAVGDYAPSFELSMARKDVRLMIEAAKGATLGVLPAIAARMDAVAAQGHAKDDVGVLAYESVPPRPRA
jgi:3-hydroxyisobutyrate dehydrogenase-like beta-hydroxyacid dehydrogenase